MLGYRLGMWNVLSLHNVSIFRLFVYLRAACDSVWRNRNLGIRA